MTRLAYVLDANDGQNPVMGCEGHGRMEKERREVGVGSLSEVLRGPGVSALLCTQGPAGTSGMTDSNPKTHMRWSGFAPRRQWRDKDAHFPAILRRARACGPEESGAGAEPRGVLYHPRGQAGLTHRHEGDADNTSIQKSLPRIGGISTSMLN